ncbi:MAG: molybdate ABC transporter substrate-binding protein, partial [Candidatus Eisenbacteria bacterium]|nr:molybdate ABC transporter substrate-binding protein [Candidatus Eisenbacteria bacterium]
VVLNLAGSQQLASQLAMGAEADVFASADERWMDVVQGKGLLAGEPAVFAHNTVVLIVPRTNPARITKLQDLAKRGVKLALALESVPVGRYSRESLALLAKLPGYTPDFAARVLANGVTEEENVKAVATKVQLAEVDAGFVYASDVTGSLARYVRVLELPQAARVPATYPIAITKASRNAALAQAFVDLVRSAEGQRVLTSHGLLPAETATPAAR